MSLQSYLNSVWYGERAGHWLRPFGALYGWVAARRLRAYADGRRSVYRPPVPVLVVGNHTVGGTGKTPLVIDIVRRLKTRGERPGVISRGYGRASQSAQLVSASSTAHEVGDEPRLIYARTAVPVGVCANRQRGCEMVLEAGATIIVADDGLQHLALARDAEIEVVDAARGYGNERCLPAGPLRLPAAQTWKTDLQIVNGGSSGDAMQLVGDHARRLSDGQTVALGAFAQGRVHAVAGIGHPDRFFDFLRAEGLEVVAHPKDDHALLSIADVTFDDDLPVLVTEKDAVKLDPQMDLALYSVPVSAQLTASADQALDALLDRLSDNSAL